MRTFSSHKARSFCSFRCKNHRTSWTKMAGNNICHIHFLRVPFSTTVPSSMPYFLMTLRSWSMSNSSVASLPAKHRGGSGRLPLCIWHMYTRYTPWKKAPCSPTWGKAQTNSQIQETTHEMNGISNGQMQVFKQRNLPGLRTS